MSGAGPPLPRVVYIVGEGRSGSTVLDLVLGQIDGWFSCGELWYLWHNDVCGCGERVFDCAVWGPVVAERLAARGDVASMMRLQPQEFGTGPGRLVALWIERRRRSRGRPGPGRFGYVEEILHLYRAVAARTGAGTLVDSSKIVTRALMLALLTDVDLSVVHLVRDPRAVSHAWGQKKIKSRDPDVYFGQRGPARSALSWLRRNAVVELALRRSLGDRFLRLRYEDLAADPRAALASICALVGVPDGAVPFSDARHVPIVRNHTVGGNPSRFAGAALDIGADERWRRDITRRTNLIATIVAAPLLRRYRYPLLLRSEPGGGRGRTRRRPSAPA